eukprot:scaffold16356_cov35-Tisochrysis_lutea.AAC.3
MLALSSSSQPSADLWPEQVGNAPILSSFCLQPPQSKSAHKSPSNLEQPIRMPHVSTISQSTDHQGRLCSNYLLASAAFSVKCFIGPLSPVSID